MTFPAENDFRLLELVAPNSVQSIRAFRVLDLQAGAVHNGQHFLYVCCLELHTKQQVLTKIATSFGFSKVFAKNYDALYDCLTDLIQRAGSQNGFVVVLEQLPCTAKFDKEAREIVLDIFRDASDYWAEKNVPFRVFYSFT